MKELEIVIKSWGLPNALSDELRCAVSICEQEVKREERQFILNILDGIDEADRQMGNEGGGTKAIRLALQSRII